MREFLSDMLSTLVFVALYMVLGDIYLATGIAIGVGISQIIYLKARGRLIDLMQWMSLGLVIVFGTATLYFHDARFIMIKPSIIYFAIAFVMLRPGWIGRYIPSLTVAHLTPRMINGWGYAWAVLMVCQGIANIAVALLFSPVVWGYFISFGTMGAKVIMFAVNYWVFRSTVRRRLATASHDGLIAATEA